MQFYHVWGFILCQNIWQKHVFELLHMHNNMYPNLDSLAHAVIYLCKIYYCMRKAIYLGQDTHAHCHFHPSENGMTRFIDSCHFRLGGSEQK